MDRRELKARARATMRRHYWMFVVVCLFAAFLGVEYGTTMWAVSAQSSESSVSSADELSAESQLQLLVQDIVGGDEQAARDQVAANEREIARADTNPMFGRSRGVFAQTLNSFSSGSVVLSVLDSARTVLRSHSVAVGLLVAVSLAVYCFVWLFVRETYRIILRRMALEARTYEKVPPTRFLYPLHTRHWRHMAWVMLAKSVWFYLWALTIVGGVIKYFSYFLVPYIVAENPSVGAAEAVTLSRRMMRGHKWECFVAHLSFLGWWLAGLLTLGLVNVFYANGYRAAFFAEWYARLRAEARARRMPGSERLCDEALFVRPDPARVAAAYPDVVRDTAGAGVEGMHLVRPAGFTGWLARWFGILLRPDGEVAAWERHEARLDALSSGLDVLRGRTYPGRLAPVEMPFRLERATGPGPQRSYTIVHLAAMFFIFCFVGWVWEVTLAFITEGGFVNRGTLHGPWLPIYGTGGLIILIALRRLREKPVLLFVGTVVLCGALEYFSSWWLERTHGQRWWDYSGYFLNLNGRICAEGLLVFGLGGLAITYLLAPVLDDLLSRVNTRALTAIVVVLAVLYCGDYAYSAFHPNAGSGITDYRGSQQ